MPALMKKITGKGVELQQLVGQRKGKRGVIEVVRHPMDLVRLDGKIVGRLARRSGCILCVTADMAEDERQELHKQVTVLRMELGKWLPVQEGKYISHVPSKTDLDAISVKEVDDELMKQAREKYGIDEDETNDTPIDLDEEEPEEELEAEDTEEDEG